MIMTNTGDTLLHCYLSSPQGELNKTTKWFLGMQFLVEKHPHAVCKLNQMGMLPFHVAALNQAPLDALFYLACQNPEALQYCSSKHAVSDHVQIIPEV